MSWGKWTLCIIGKFGPGLYRLTEQGEYECGYIHYNYTGSHLYNSYILMFKVSKMMDEARVDNNCLLYKHPGSVILSNLKVIKHQSNCLWSRKGRAWNLSEFLDFKPCYLLHTYLFDSNIKVKTCWDVSEMLVNM